jgi:P4 family phage/plasmid primase-like protien
MVDAKEIIEHLYEPNLYFNEGKFIAQMLAGNIAFQFFDEITGEGINRGFLVTKDNKEIYRYNGGYYEADGEDFIRSIAQVVLKEKATEHYLSEVVSWVTTNSFLHIDRAEFNPDIDIINVENGLYNIKTGEFGEHDQGYRFISQIPVKYDPDADCPLIKKFIGEIVYEQDFAVLQEWFGYCLLRGYPFHVACMLIGDGKNGKSTLLRLLTRFLGGDNVSTKELANLIFNRFSIAKLYGKLANISPDISDKALTSTGLFKAITGGDRVDAEEKFKGSFEFTNHAKLIFSCNKLPKSDDETYAFFRRWILISFPNTFDGDKCDHDILNKITTEQELSGLLNWSLQGLKRLLANGKFSYGKTVEDVQTQYKTLSDPIYAFCAEHLTSKEGERLPKADVYEKYVTWAKKKMLPITATNMFTVELAKHMPGMRTGTSGGERNRKPAYVNITWAVKTEETVEKNDHEGGLEKWFSP